MSSSHLLHAFLLDRQASGCSVKTLEWHEAALTMFVCWLEDQGSSSPDTWTPTLIRQYIVHLQTRPTARGKPLSGASVNSYVGSVLAFLRWCYLEELIEKDIAARVKKPPRPKQMKRPFSDVELAALFRVAKQSSQRFRDTAILSVLLDCGLRAAELVSLTTSDVLFDQGLIVIRQGKGAKDRVVAMSADTAKAITKYKLRERPETETVELFVDSKGNALLPNAIRLLVQRLAKKAGVEDATAHRFRRTFATAFLRNGGNLYDLKTLMGHTDLQVTSAYLFVDEDDLKRSHDAASPLMRLKRRDR